MAAIKEEVKYAEVVSKCTVKGELIPLKITVQDEDGEYQSFVIKGYKPVHCNVAHRCFDCKIETFGVEQIIRLFYNSTDYRWRIISNKI